ncbi:MAG: DNA polymerase beta superfamily protein [Chloroflexota bacterium]
MQRVLTPVDPAVAAQYPAWKQAWDEAQYVSLHGSEAYGLATGESDLDLKGVSIPRREALLGYRDLPPEQLEFSPDGGPPGRLAGPHDAAIFSLQKLCRLGAACNPNAVEMLFVEGRHVVKMTPLGRRGSAATCWRRCGASAGSRRRCANGTSTRSGVARGTPSGQYWSERTAMIQSTPCTSCA